MRPRGCAGNHDGRCGIAFAKSTTSTRSLTPSGFGSRPGQHIQALSHLRDVVNGAKLSPRTCRTKARSAVCRGLDSGAPSAVLSAGKMALQVSVHQTRGDLWKLLARSCRPCALAFNEQP